METEGLLDYYQRRAGIISIVRWNLRPVIFGVDSLPQGQTQFVLATNRGRKAAEKAYVFKANVLLSLAKNKLDRHARAADTFVHLQVGDYAMGHMVYSWLIQWGHMTYSWLLPTIAIASFCLLSSYWSCLLSLSLNLQCHLLLVCLLFPMYVLSDTLGFANYHLDSFDLLAVWLLNSFLVLLLLLMIAIRFIGSV